MNKDQKEIIKKVNEILEEIIGTELSIHEVRDESDDTLVGYNCCFEWWSDLGEDLYEEFDIPRDFDVVDVWREFDKLYDGFDVDEHVEPLIEIRGTRGVPSSISRLVKDAEEIEGTYEELADKIAEALNVNQ